MQRRWEERTLSIQGNSISILLRKGKGNPMVYFPGLGCRKEDCLPLAAQPLLQDQTFLTIDFPGSGASLYPTDCRLSFRDLAEMIQEIFCHLALSPVILIGHSMGGLLALLFSHWFPKQIHTLIDIEGNFAPEDCTFSREIASTSFLDFQRSLLPQFLKKLRNSSFKGNRTYAESLALSDPLAIFHYALPLVTWSDSLELVPLWQQLKMPRLFLYGEESPTYTYLSKLAVSLAQVRGIPHSHHSPHLDNPSDCAETISQFLIEKHLKMR